MPSLSDNDRQSLLHLARLAITEAVSRGQILADIPAGGIFSEQRGVFVTLHIGERLRGCLGVVEPEHPLGDSIVRCATGAAMRDPRFPVLRSHELSHLQIEISLPSIPRPICPEEIEIGSHGLLIVQGSHRGLLLPQVALTHQLTVQQFLAEACRKAQVPPEAWRDSGTRLLGFTCEVFSNVAASQNLK
jgi:AmmeMemoRadiSam system protein A